MVYGIIGIWVLCGLLAYGQWIGHCKEEYEPVLGIESVDIFFAFCNLVLGPIGLFVTNITFLTLDKRLFKPRFQFRTSPPTDPRFR